MNKFVFVTCVVVIAVCSAEDPRGPRSEEFKKVMEQCKAETGATDDDIKTLITRQQMTSKNGFCLVGCIKKKTGIMDASNKLDMAKLRDQMSGMQAANPDMFNKMITAMQQCKDEVEADSKNLADQCVAAKAFGDCFFTKKSVIGIP